MTIKLTNNGLIKLLQIILLVAILVLVAWGQPWDSNSTQNTLKVDGQATVEAVPDEFTFYPYFEQTAINTDASEEELVAATNKVVEDLKQLGVNGDDITINANSFELFYLDEGQEGTVQVSVEIKVDNKELAQKVQDYLLTTEAKGQLTPQGTFSEQKQQELQKEATEKAIADAKEKATTQASLFNKSIGDVISVDQSGVNDMIPYPLAEARDATTSSSLPVSPGKNEYSVTIAVVYELQ